MPLFQLEAGWAGVNLFFILSGFLMTRILMTAKAAGAHTYFTNFYSRRALRIFPLYYMYLLLAGLFLYFASHSDLSANPHITEAWRDLRLHWPYLLSFTYNFEEITGYLTGVDYTNSWFFGHLWTLSVEVQFYFVFALLVYALPLRWLKIILISVIVITPLLRWFTISVLTQNVQDLFWIGDVLYISTPFQIDTLSLGALLAIIDLQRWRRMAVPMAVGSVLLLAVVGTIHIMMARQYGVRMPLSSLGFDIPTYHTMTLSPGILFNNRYVYSIPLVNLFFTSLLLCATALSNLPRWMESGFAIYVGRISYGIYVLHLVVSLLVSAGFEMWFRTPVDALTPLAQVAGLVVYLVLLLLMGSASYYGFERKFLRLRAAPVY